MDERAYVHIATHFQIVLRIRVKENWYVPKIVSAITKNYEIISNSNIA